MKGPVLVARRWQAYFPMAVVLIFSFAMVGCEKFPDFGEKGGPPIPEAEIGRSFYRTERTDNPSCGVFFYRRAYVEKELKGECKDEMKAIYGRATMLADSQIARVECPDDKCEPKAPPFLQALDTDCYVRMAKSGKWVAYADVEKGSVCPESGMEVPGGLPEPAGFTESRLVKGVPKTGDFRGRPDGISPMPKEKVKRPNVERGKFGPVVCEGRERVQFLKMESPRNCKSEFMKEFVAKAEAEAEAYHSIFSCQADCRKVPFDLYRQEWSCRPPASITQAATARSQVIFDVNCKKPTATPPEEEGGKKSTEGGK